MLRRRSSDAARPLRAGKAPQDFGEPVTLPVESAVLAAHIAAAV
jgi:hypothetical protein